MFLEFWNFGILEFWNFEKIDCISFGILELCEEDVEPVTGKFLSYLPTHVVKGLYEKLRVLFG